MTGEWQMAGSSHWRRGGRRQGAGIGEENGGGAVGSGNRRMVGGRERRILHSIFIRKSLPYSIFKPDTNSSFYIFDDNLHVFGSRQNERRECGGRQQWKSSGKADGKADG